MTQFDREQIIGRLRVVEQGKLTKLERRLLALMDAADVMRARIAEEDGRAHDFGRWHECAAYDDLRDALETYGPMGTFISENVRKTA